jgi:hypothetical protein
MYMFLFEFVKTTPICSIVWSLLSVTHQILPQLTSLCCILKVTSEITGPMVVEDVVYENVDGDQSCMSEKMFRRLIFKRNSSLVQSEALLISDPPCEETDNKNKTSSAASKKKSQKKGLTGIFLLMLT